MSLFPILSSEGFFKPGLALLALWCVKRRQNQLDENSGALVRLYLLPLSLQVVPGREAYRSAFALSFLLTPIWARIGSLFGINRILLTQLGQPIVERFRSGADALSGGVARERIGERKVGLAIGTIQTDDQVIRMMCIHALIFLSWSPPRGLTRRHQYRRVVLRLGRPLE
jgi:hypothetical protein